MAQVSNSIGDVLSQLSARFEAPLDGCSVRRLVIWHDSGGSFESEFDQYCNDLTEDAKQATIDAGANSMDTHQADDFCKAIEKLLKE